METIALNTTSQPSRRKRKAMQSKQTKPTATINVRLTGLALVKINLSKLHHLSPNA